MAFHLPLFPPEKHLTSVISKLNFFPLFKQAWIHAVTPEVVTSGFRKAGVYPLNRAQISVSKKKDSHMIDGDGDSVSGGERKVDGHAPCDSDGGDGDKCSNDDCGDDNSCGGGDNSVDGHTNEDPLNVNNLCSGTENIVSVEKEQIYTRHFEEGYDIIFDAEYVCRLREHHPEAVPAAYTTTVDGNTSEDPLIANTSQIDDSGAGKENVLSIEKELIYTRRLKKATIFSIRNTSVGFKNITQKLYQLVT